MANSIKQIKACLKLMMLVCAAMFHWAIPAQTNSISQDDHLERLFSMSIEELMQIEITTAGKTSQNINDVPASVTVIHRQEIETYGYKNVQEILENITGLYITDEKGEYGTQINVRGIWSQTPSYMIIMVNGVPQIDEVNSTYSLQNIYIPVQAIERIEVIRGPISIMYGSGAFFGAINIITISSEDNGSVQTSLGNNNMRNAGIYFNKASDDINLSMSFLYEKGDGDDIAYNDIMTDFTRYPDFKDQTIDNAFGHESKHFNLRSAYKGIYCQLTYSENDFNYQVGLPPSPDQVAIKTRRYFSGTIGFEQQVAKWMHLEAQVNMYSSNIERSNIYFPFTQSKIYGFALDEARYNDFKLDVFLHPNEKLNLTLGIHYKTILRNLGRADFPALPTSTNHSFRLHEDSHSNRYAAYAQLEYQVSDQLLFYAGIRLEQDSRYKIFNHYNQGQAGGGNYFEGEVPKSDWNIIPRIAAIYTLKENNVIKLMYGKATKSPALVNNWDVLIGNNDGSGDTDPFLKSEVINTLELNYHAVINPNFSINASLYNNSLTYLIIRTRSLLPDLTYRYSTVNAGTLRSRGIEVHTRTKLTPKLEMDLAATYQHTKNKNNPTIPVAHSPSFLAYIKGAYHFSGSSDNTNQVTLSVLGNFVDRMYASWDEATETRRGETSKAYFLLSSHLHINNFIIPRLYTNLKISNIFNTQYHYSTSPSAIWADKGMIGEKRAILVSMGWKF